MKTDDFKKIVKSCLEEELKKVLGENLSNLRYLIREEIKFENRNILKTESISDKKPESAPIQEKTVKENPAQPSSPATMRKISNDPILNKILNETVVKPELFSENSSVLDQQNQPDILKNIFKKDYRGLLKKVEEKVGH